MMPNNSPMMNTSGTSESYVTPSHYGNKNVHQQQMSQGDGYGSSTTDSSPTGNFYVPTTSNTSMMNNQSSCIRFLQTVLMYLNWMMVHNLKKTVFQFSYKLCQVPW
uniref:Uncharacterized protein n=1 Tax=Lactuca sativa TaxID=4236 RepID=A0A9R1XHR2_LACSA|nr:hypothetical protein LSAT_V11C400195450 [Lactuca sativa]